MVPAMAPRRRTTPAAADAGPTFGERIRAARRAQGLTLEEAAARSGIALNHLQRIEQGSGNPTARTLSRVANGLRVELSALLATREAASAAETALNEPASVTPRPRPEDLETTLSAFPQRLRRLRQSRGWSCQELATKAGVTPQFLRRVEAGQHVPTLRVVLQLSTALRVTLEGLVYAETVEGVSDEIPSRDG